MIRRVLIADSNEDAAESLALLLQMNGLLAATAYTGPDVLALATVLHPEAAFLTLRLPRLSGHEVCRQLRTGIYGDPPRLLVALTGDGRECDREAARAAGFDYHLLKPIAPERILSLLRCESGKGRSAIGVPTNLTSGLRHGSCIEGIPLPIPEVQNEYCDFDEV